MATLVYDEYVEKQIREQRLRCDAYKLDEVWDGVYVVLPTRDIHHQDIVGNLASILLELLGFNGPIRACMQCAVSDRAEGWETNYRIPDLSVVMQDGCAKDCGSHYCGGPDFLVEVVTPHDRSREKIAFYGKISVRELLIVDRDPWCLELYRLEADTLMPNGTSRLGQSSALSCEVLPLSFGLIAGESRPQIQVFHSSGSPAWLA